MPGPALVHLGGVRRFGGLAQPPRWVKVAPPVSAAGVGVPGLRPACALGCPSTGGGLPVLAGTVFKSEARRLMFRRAIYSVIPGNRRGCGSVGQELPWQGPRKDLAPGRTFTVS